jgi:UDP-glucose 4-epimerase
MKILITGAAGGIGSSLAVHLHEKGFELILVDNLRNGYIQNIPDYLTSFFYQVDINSKEFENLVTEHKPEVVFHLAAITALPDCESNITECLRINVEGTSHVLNLCRLNSVKRVIFSSTSAIYENNEHRDGFKESEPTNPTLFYSLSKKMSEDICASFRNNYAMDVIIFRLFNVYGPRQDIYRKSPPLINYIVREFKDKRTPVLHSDGTQARDYVHIEDILSTFEISISKKFSHNYIFNLCSGKTLTVNQIVSIIKGCRKEFESIEVIYRESSKLWDQYTNLFSNSYSLSKARVSKETNKFSLGDNTLFIQEFGYSLSSEHKLKIEDTVNEILLSY